MSSSFSVVDVVSSRKEGSALVQEVGGRHWTRDWRGPDFLWQSKAIKLLKHPIASQRSKHIDVLHHFAGERVARKEVEFAYCPTGEMAVDFLTKAMPVGKFKKCCEMVGIKEVIV
jgi:hypothetical protein